MTDATAKTVSDTAQKAMPSINFPRLLDTGAGIISKLLITAPKVKAKALFKELKNGQTLNLGKLRVGDIAELQVDLALDYSEFKGPGFNFDVFRAALAMMLQRIAAKLRARDDLNLRSNPSAVLVFLPGIVKIQEQHNVLVLALENSARGHLTLKLMFLDPNQFNQAFQGGDAAST